MFFRLGQQSKKHVSVPGIQAVLNMIPPLFEEIRIDPHQLIKLLVESDDVDILFAVPAVEDHRPQHIVEHGVGKDVVIHEFADRELLIGFETDPGGIHNGPVTDQILKVLRRHRPIEVVPLHVPAAQPLQEFQLFFGFNPLDNDRDEEVLGHVDDGFQDVDAFFGAVFRDLQELGIQLDHIHVDVPQHVQRRIAAPEIIHQHLEPAFLQAGDGVAHLPEVIGIGRLGNLNLHAVRRQLILLHQCAQLCRYIQRRNVQLGHIDRNRDQRFPALLHLTLPPADRLPDMQVQLGHQTVFFQDRDEDRRRDEAAVPALPAGQGFGPDDFAVGSANLGLEKECDFPSVQAVLKLEEDLIFFRAFPMELCIIQAHARMGFAVQAFRRKRRPVVVFHDLCA